MSKRKAIKKHRMEIKKCKKFQPSKLDIELASWAPDLISFNRQWLSWKKVFIMMMELKIKKIRRM